MSKLNDQLRAIVNATRTNKNNLRLSEQAIATFAVIFQKAVLEGKKADEMFLELDFMTDGDNELFVTNPPNSVLVSKEFLSSLGEEYSDDEDDDDEDLITEV